jgi:hypothetical protein
VCPAVNYRRRKLKLAEISFLLLLQPAAVQYWFAAALLNLIRGATKKANQTAVRGVGRYLGARPGKTIEMNCSTRTFVP